MPFPEPPAPGERPAAANTAATEDAPRPNASFSAELRLASNLVAAAVLIAGLYFGREILVPLALAVLLGFVLDPLVNRLKRWGIPRAVAVITVVALTLSLLAGIGFFVVSQLSALSAQLPTYQSTIKDKLHRLRDDVSRPGMFDGVVKTLDTLRVEVEAPPVAVARARAPQHVVIDEQPPSPLRSALGFLEAASGPLATAGIVIVFVVLILFDRLDLRDRLLRLWGGKLHRPTVAMDEAGERIGKYLRMQLVVNLTYGIPLALGLWIIGVPGAILWGLLAGVLRFVPYVGPMIAGVFPVALAFAVDPGWGMVLWTLGLIGLIELVSNNVVEPLLYGASTGLSAISLIVSAMFWTAIWGPVGLIMATPLTVCLVVVGRYLPQLRFLDVLLGAQPALDTTTRIYQRLLAGNEDEAVEIALAEAQDEGLANFYDQVALPVVRNAGLDRWRESSVAQQRHVLEGMKAVLQALERRYPDAPVLRSSVACFAPEEGALNVLPAQMLAHLLRVAGIEAHYRDARLLDADDPPDELVCLCYLGALPPQPVDEFSLGLPPHWDAKDPVVCAWSVDPADAGDVATDLAQAVERVRAGLHESTVNNYEPASVPPDEAHRLEVLATSTLLDDRADELLHATVRDTAEIFAVPLVTVTVVEANHERVRAAHRATHEADADHADAPVVPLGEVLEKLQESGAEVDRSNALGAHVIATGKSLVVADLLRDERLSGIPGFAAAGLRFYAGAPLRGEDGTVLGVLALYDTQPREMDARDQKVLEEIADDLGEKLRAAGAEWARSSAAAGPPPEESPPSAPDPVKADQAPASATVAQAIPL